jgi:hemolysin III
VLLKEDGLSVGVDMKRGEFYNSILGRLRDPISCLSHFIGAVLSIIGMAILIFQSFSPFKPLHFVSYFAFGAGMISLYSASALYHWTQSNEQDVDYYRRIDQMMIFIGIAGGYTPLCLIPLKGVLGWSLCLIVWIVAIIGVYRKYIGFDEPQWVTTMVYLGMGWLMLMALYPLFLTLKAWAVFWLFFGGCLYTIGAIIDVVEKPDPWPKLLGYHEIFHILVLMGSACHFWLMYKYILVLN